jgi:anthranilate 1,2-dioxygenase large subunit
MNQITRTNRFEEDALRVPYQVFTDPEILALEQEKIFRGRVWAFVGMAAEVPNAGDYKSTFIGLNPVILTRADDGSLHVLENRCAHRGAIVCDKKFGNAPTLKCVYHQWDYNLKGDLNGVPFLRGVKGKGGMCASFDKTKSGLPKLRVASLHGLVFATWSDDVEPLEDYLGPVAVRMIARECSRPLKVLGYQRQFIHSNWKLGAENSRDTYHAGLLHLFLNTFGLYRNTDTSAIVSTDATGRHALVSTESNAGGDADNALEAMHAYKPEFVLKDPSVVKSRREFDDDVNLVVLSIFPNLVVHQIGNALSTRHIIPTAPDAFEMIWTQFGYADDDADMERQRILHGNLIGPAGFVSLEDGDAMERVQRAVAGARHEASYMGFIDDQITTHGHFATENSIKGFWDFYRTVMGLDRAFR